MMDGMPQRFCQLCSCFHSLAEFDGTKRSCRERYGSAKAVLIINMRWASAPLLVSASCTLVWDVGCVSISLN